MTQAAHPSVHGGDDPDPCRAEATGVSDDQRSCRGPPLAVRVRPSGGARCKTVRIGKPRTHASASPPTSLLLENPGRPFDPAEQVVEERPFAVAAGGVAHRRVPRAPAFEAMLPADRVFGSHLP